MIDGEEDHGCLPIRNRARDEGKIPIGIGASELGSMPGPLIVLVLVS
jgi:hypothetical protein